MSRPELLLLGGELETCHACLCSCCHLLPLLSSHLLSPGLLCWLACLALLTPAARTCWIQCCKVKQSQQTCVGPLPSALASKQLSALAWTAVLACLPCPACPGNTYTMHLELQINNHSNSVNGRYHLLLSLSSHLL